MPQKPTFNSDNVRALLKEWKSSLSVKAKAHSIATGQYRRLYLCMGLPTSIVTSLSGISVLSGGSFEDEEVVFYIQLFAGITTVVGGMMVALMTFLNPASYLEKHKETANSLYALITEIDEILAFDLEGQYAEIKEQIGDLSHRIQESQKNAPSLSARVVAVAEKLTRVKLQEALIEEG